MKKYEFESTGVIRYNPERSGMNVSRTKWWCVLNIDPGIIYYYKWWIDKHWWEADRSPVKRKYSLPSTPAHMSIIRGEKPRKNKKMWEYNNGKRIKFKYSLKIRQTGDTTNYNRPDHFWFLDAYFKEYNEIRAEFGLPTSYPDGKLFFPHITVARVFP